LSDNFRAFGQQAGDVAQQVISSTPQALSDAWQSVGKVISEHAPIAREHLNNIATELRTKQLPSVINKADFSPEALTVHVLEAGDKLEQAKGKASQLLQWIKDHGQRCKRWVQIHAPELLQRSRDHGEQVVQWIKDHPDKMAAMVAAVVLAAICRIHIIVVVLWAIHFIGFGILGPVAGGSAGQ